jgi:hypothetical protein
VSSTEVHAKLRKTLENSRNPSRRISQPSIDGLAHVRVTMWVTREAKTSYPQEGAVGQRRVSACL